MIDRRLPAALALLAALATVAEAAPRVVARAERPVVPLLVGEPRAPLCRLVIRVDGEGEPPRLESLAIGGDLPLAVHDIRLLRGDGEAGPAPRAEAIAGPRIDAGRMHVDGGVALGAGDNVFWIVGAIGDDADLLDRVSLSIREVSTSGGVVAVDDASPGVRQRIGVALRRHGQDGVHTTRIPVLAVTPAGTLLAAYDLRHRDARDLQEDIDVGLSRSTDGGRTWEPTRTIMDMGTAGGLPEEQNGCGDPGILVDDVTGRVWVFALWVHGKPGKHQWNDDGSEPGFDVGKTAQFMAVHSDDEGRTWSAPENLTRDLKEESWWLFAPAPQAGFTRADGMLVMPVQGRFAGGRLDSFATIMTSPDRGATWRVGAFGYTGGNECQAAGLADGSIMLNVRSDRQRFRGVAVTSDLGDSWSRHPTSDTVLEEPNCNGSLLALPTPGGRRLLLFANPLSQKDRSHQTIRVSDDDGATWPEERRILLDEGRGRGYPSLTRVAADRVGIVYEGSRADVVFQVVSVSDLMEAAP